MNINIVNEKHEVQKIWYSYYIWPILSTIFFMIFWSFNINYFSYIGLLFYFIPLLFLNFTKCIQIYYFLLPNISLFKLGTYSLALSSVFSLLLLFKILINKKFRVNLFTLLLLIAYFITSIVTYLVAKNNLTILSQEVRVIIDILIVFSILEINKANLRNLFQNISNAFIIGCMATSLSGVFYVLTKNIKLDGYRLEAVNSDPNYFSLCMAFAISLILLKIFHYGTKNYDLFILLFLTISGLMSLSRGYIIAMAINILFFMYLFLISSKMSLLKRISIIVLLIFTIMVMNDFLYNLYQHFLNRTLSEETSGGSGRIDIWIFYLEKTFSSIRNILFGLGAPNEKLFGSNIFSVQHNIYLELFTGKGIVGTVIVISLYIHLYKTIKKFTKAKQNDIISFFPLITIAIGFMFLNGLVSDIGIMTIFLGFLTANIYSHNKQFNS